MGLAAGPWRRVRPARTTPAPGGLSGASAGGQHPEEIGSVAADVAVIRGTEAAGRVVPLEEPLRGFPAVAPPDAARRRDEDRAVEVHADGELAAGRRHERLVLESPGELEELLVGHVRQPSGEPSRRRATGSAWLITSPPPERDDGCVRAASRPFWVVATLACRESDQVG